MLAMPTTEQEIVEKFGSLDADAQSRVLSRLQNSKKLAQPVFDSTFDYDGWFKRIEALQERVRERNGGTMPEINVMALVNEVREEE